MSYRVPPKETQWVLFEFACEKSLNAKYLITSRRRIRIILTKFLSGEHGSFYFSTLEPRGVANPNWPLDCMGKKFPKISTFWAAFWRKRKGRGESSKISKITDFRSKIVYSFSSDPEGEWKNCQRVLKFLPLIFGSETSKQVKWVGNVRVDYWAAGWPSLL
jgi:hypothetical protein